jgi:hypothetical protein
MTDKLFSMPKTKVSETGKILSALEQIICKVKKLFIITHKILSMYEYNLSATDKILSITNTMVKIACPAK